MLALVRRVFAPVAIAFLLYFAWDTRETLLATVRSGELLRLLAAILTWSLMHLVSPLLASLVFRARGHAFFYGTAAKIHIENLPARYIPGGIWHTVGRIAGFRQAGMSQLDIGVFVFLENALAVSVAFGIGGSIVASYEGVQGWGAVAAASAGGGLVMLLMAPFILSHRIVRGDAGFEWGAYVGCIATVCLSWCIGAAAFVLYVTAFPDLAVRTSPVETGGAYLLAWGIGFVSFFAPQGIGVFEVVAGDLMRGAASVKDIAALLIGFRIVILLADAATWASQQALSATRARY